MHSSICLYLVSAGKNGTVSLVAPTMQLNNKFPFSLLVRDDSCVCIYIEFIV